MLVMGGLMYVSMHCLLHSGYTGSLARKDVAVPLQIISYLVAGGFLILAYRIHFKPLFVGVVGGFAGWICLLGVVLLPYHEVLQADRLGDWILGHVGGDLGLTLSLLIRKWVGVLFYLTMDVFNVTAIALMTWGIINQVSQFSEAFRYYIPLAFSLSMLAGIISFVVNFLQVNLIIPPLLSEEIQDISEVTSWVQGSYLFLIAAVCLGCVLLVFHRMCINIPKERWRKESTLKDFHFSTFLLSIAVLFFGLSFSEQLFETPFSQELALQFASAPPEQFTAFMAVNSFRTGGLTLIVKIISVFLGTWLLKKKGWIPTSLSAALVILGSGILVWSFALASGHFPISLSFIHRAIYAGFRIGLFFALIQMTYLKIPRHERFFAMSLVELAMIPVLNGMGGEIARIIPLQFPSEALQFPALSIFFVLTILILMRSISFLGRATGLGSFHLRNPQPQSE
jgi:ATP/ADP translocase